jgi:general secretion pathway protein G
MLVLLLVLCATSCATTRREHKAIAFLWIAEFKTALDAFEVDCGRYPSTSEGSSALITRPPNLGVDQWRGPYLQTHAIPSDPWGHQFVYLCPGKHNTDAFDLYSFGPDGMSKTGGEDADDINSWSLKSCR